MTNAQTLDITLFKGKAKKAAKLLRTLSNEKRLMILCRLSGGEATVGDMLKEFDMSQSAFSQHLAILREQDLVKTRRESQSIFYSISDPSAMRVIETLAAIYCPEMLL